MTGAKARADRGFWTVEREYRPVAGDIFTLGTSRLPEFRPRAPAAGAVEWLRQNPWETANLVEGPTLAR